MLQVKLWNKQIPSYTHTEIQIKQTNKFCTHPLTLCLPHCLWENTFELFVHCILLLLPSNLKALWDCVSVQRHSVSLETQTHHCMRPTVHMQRDCASAERGGPSGHPCHAMFPVKCCQRGLCGLLWRLKACSTALPAQAADLRKGNLGRSNGRVAPELFTALCTALVPPTIFHMRTGVCGTCSDVCVCELGGISASLHVSASTFIRKCKLWMYACKHLYCFRTYKLIKNQSLKSETQISPLMRYCHDYDYVFTCVDISTCPQSPHSFNRASGIIVGVGGNSVRPWKRRSGASD